MLLIFLVACRGVTHETTRTIPIGTVFEKGLRLPCDLLFWGGGGGGGPAIYHDGEIISA
jgi:hypothetical protein